MQLTFKKHRTLYFLVILGLSLEAHLIKTVITAPVEKTVIIPTSTWELLTSQGNPCDYSERYTIRARTIATEIGVSDVEKIHVYTADKVGSCAWPDKDLIIINTHEHPNDIRYILAHEAAHIKYEKSSIYKAIPLFIAGFTAGYKGIPIIITYLNKRFFKKNKIIKKITSSEIFKIICGTIIATCVTNLYRKYAEYRADSTAITYLKKNNDTQSLYDTYEYFEYSHNETMTASPLLAVVNKYCGTLAIDIVDTMMASITCNMYSYFEGHPSCKSRALHFKTASESI